MINGSHFIKKAFYSLCGTRNLYSASSLGLDGYIKSRGAVKSQFHDIEDKFKNKMNDFVVSDTHMIFTEDLKNMIHLTENNESDMGLVRKMMLKFWQQNKSLRFGSFIFGPVIMRMYYYLEKPLDALDIFKEPAMNGFFDQLSTYQVLLDLLFKHELFQEMLDVFLIIKEKQIQGTIYPKNVIVLVFAACYKLNSSNSLEFAQKLWSELAKTGYYPQRRAATFAAALALQQNAPHIALEILTSTNHQNYVSVRNLKVAAFADLNRPDDAFPIFKTFLENDTNFNDFEKKQPFYEEVMEKMRISVNKSGRKEIIQSFERIESQLKNLELITSSPLSELLCSEINQPKDLKANNKQSRTSQGKFRLRPGLQDLI